ncbi:MAG: GYF domain-containing protein [Planctomycetaceae bacterium]|jgi:TM2 domain-containing membrane protein YozV|nr:GYF domain-containing protein [Planctomycetaceae bacterium]
MIMQIELNGVVTTVTKERLLELAAKGELRPDSIITVDGTKKYKASQVKGLDFGYVVDDSFLKEKLSLQKKGTPPQTPLQTPSEINWYYSQNGVQQGPINQSQLTRLIQNEILNADTLVWCEGMFSWSRIADTKLIIYLPIAPRPMRRPTAGYQPFPNPQSNPVSPQQYPNTYPSFCTNCGTRLNSPNQVICVKCGHAIRGVKSRVTVGSGAQKKRIIAILLAFFLGGLGAHKFYLGSWGWGIVYIAVFLFMLLATFGFGCIVCGVAATVEFIMFLVMDDETFAERYSPETEHPFRW